MDPFEQLQAWIEQQQTQNQQQLHKQLGDWSKLLKQAEQSAISLSPGYAGLVSQVCRQNEGFIQLLRDLGTHPDADPGAQVKQLRERLHQLNLEYLLHSAEIPEQYMPLVFTQLKPGAGLTNAQFDALEQAIDQIDAPYLKPLKQLLNSILHWHQSAQNMLDQLNSISDASVTRWLEKTSTHLSEEERLNLWVNTYDSQFQQAFQRADMQGCQGAIINSLTEVKSDWRKLIEQISEPLGLPTRSQIDQLIDGMDSQRRRIRALERELAQLKADQKLSDQ